MRDYDPTLGRYIQADPLGLVDGASIYGYALQNPGRYIDPRGTTSFDTASCMINPLLCVANNLPRPKPDNQCPAAADPIDPTKPDTMPPPPPASGGNECARLVSKMNNIIENLRTRFKQWRRNQNKFIPGEPPFSRRKGNFSGHVQQIWSKQQQLKATSKLADAKQCQYNRTRVYYWIHRPVPFPGAIGGQ